MANVLKFIGLAALCGACSGGIDPPELFHEPPTVKQDPGTGDNGPSTGVDLLRHKGRPNDVSGSGGQGPIPRSETNPGGANGGGTSIPGAAGSGGSLDPTGGDGGGGTDSLPGSGGSGGSGGTVEGPLPCEALTADCDGNPDNGCETDLASDPSNCGACGNACPAGDGETAFCTEASGCGATSCDPGLGDCDGDGTCEADLSSDDANCGACGKSCTEGSHCVESECESSSCEGFDLWVVPNGECLFVVKGTVAQPGTCHETDLGGCATITRTDNPPLVTMISQGTTVSLHAVVDGRCEVACN